MTGSIESVLVYVQGPLLLCLMLGVAGVFILRRRAEPAGFRCPWFPLPPVLFILCTLAILIYSACSKPWVALAGMGTMIFPLLVHPLIASRRKD
jgi:APA family basic amino acid/polyamine antiporter